MPRPELLRADFFGRIPDFGARTVVFIPSHLFHPLHLCPPREISSRESLNQKMDDG